MVCEIVYQADMGVTFLRSSVTERDSRADKERVGVVLLLINIDVSLQS